MRPAALALAGADGRAWYTDARREIVRYALANGHCPRTVAGMLAITSPRVSVARSVALTCEILAGRPVRHLGRVLRAVDEYRETGRISGPKVVAFYRALSGDHDAVVVDTWLARAYGRPSSPSTKDRREIDRSVRATARHLGWTPAETQAAIWCGVIRAHGREPALLRF